MIKLKLLFLALIASLLMSAPVLAVYNPLSAACGSGVGNGNTANSPTCQSSKSAGSTNPGIDIIHTIASVVAEVAGLIAVITIIYAGIKYIVSGDNPESQKQARETIVGSLVGLIIIALAWTIVTVITNLLS